MQTFVSTMEKWIGAEEVHALEGCIGCGNCGQACAWYLATNDERLHPKNRLRFISRVYQRYLTPGGKLLGALGLIETPTVEDLRANMDVYWKCTLCGRCTLACPQGLSLRRIFRIARAGYTESGLSAENPTLRSIIENTRNKRHSFGLSRDEVLGRVGLFLDYEGVELPVDVPGAEYLFICPAAGNTKIPEIGIKLVKLLNAAGVSYTISPSVIDTGTEIDHITVHHELSRQMLLEWEQAAERLGVKKVLVAECGCDVRTMYVEATETLGRPFKFPIESVDTLFQEAMADGRLPVEPIDASVTFHDPCYVTRLSGLGERYREMLGRLTRDFREMTPNREHNYCCNAGSGGMRLPENTELRRKASRFKAEQIKNTGADLVTTPCAVCYLSLKDTTEYYGLADAANRKARMFFEVVYDAAYKALERMGQLDRFRMPAPLMGVDREFFAAHSVSGLLAQLRGDPNFPALLEKFRNDPNVANYQRENPGFADYFASLLEQVA